MSAAGPAGGRQRPARADLLTIGEVLAELREDFPDTTHSKVRFLEERGLVTPARTPSGYRKFSREHLARLRLVLTLQRDRYLPLKVIAEHLAALDAGEQVHPPTAPPPAQPDTTPAPRPRGRSAAPVAASPTGGARRAAPRPTPTVATGGREPSTTPPPPAAPAAAHHRPPPAVQEPDQEPAQGPAAAPPPPEPALAPPEPRSLADLVVLAGGDAALVSALGDHGLLPPPHAGAATDAVVRAAATLASFGIEPRHLRALRTAAEREAALIEAVAAPLRRARTAGAQRDAAAVAGERIEATFASLRAALLSAALASPR